MNYRKYFSSDEAYETFLRNRAAADKEFEDYMRLNAEFRLPPPPNRRHIFGMIPWMFWTLVGAVLFAIVAPFIPRLR